MPSPLQMHPWPEGIRETIEIVSIQSQLKRLREFLFFGIFFVWNKGKLILKNIFILRRLQTGNHFTIYLLGPERLNKQFLIVSWTKIDFLKKIWNSYKWCSVDEKILVLILAGVAFEQICSHLEGIEFFEH